MNQAMITLDMPMRKPGLLPDLTYTFLAFRRFYTPGGASALADTVRFWFRNQVC